MATTTAIAAAATEPAPRMKLKRLRVSRYRSLRDVSIDFGDLSVLVGANGAGKSNILDLLRLLHQAVTEKSFSGAVRQRGGILHLAWKGEDADSIAVAVTCAIEQQTFEWSVEFIRDHRDFYVKEHVYEIVPSVGRVHRLECDDGRGWWSSADRDRVDISLSPTDCALTAAAADSTFPGREIAGFVRGWGFFDPNPWILRRAGDEAGELGAYGENLASRLKWLKETRPVAYEKILTATRAILGVPEELDFRENEGRVYLTQREPGLRFGVHQVGASSGTLRMLALMTALHGGEGTGATLIGFEEPENHIHPVAVASFAESVLDAVAQAQVVITTHSAILVNRIGDPAVLRIVKRHGEDGTQVETESNPVAIRRALVESGFGLGEWLETKGFGA
jgi:predicted ATPase